MQHQQAKSTSLLSSGANVNAVDSNSSLHFAVDMVENDIARFPIENGARIDVANINGATPVSIALARGNDNFVLWMRIYTFTVPEGWKPLHYAATQGHPPLGEHRITNGASATEQDDNGKLPLRHAYKNFQVDVVDYLEAEMCELGVEPDEMSVQELKSIAMNALAEGNQEKIQRMLVDILSF